MGDVTSHNQSGGITAQNVSLSDSGGVPPVPKKPRWHRAFLAIAGVLAAAAAVVAIFSWFGITPWGVK